jgi:hypothetical protein
MLRTSTKIHLDNILKPPQHNFRVLDSELNLMTLL